MNSYNVTILVFTGFIFVIGSVLNFIVLMVYKRFHRNYSSVILLVSLAICNLFNSFIIAPLVALSELEDFIEKSVAYCQVYMFFLYSANSFNISFLTLIAFDRLKIISKSVNRNVYISFKKVQIVIIFILICITINYKQLWQLSQRKIKNKKPYVKTIVSYLAMLR